MLRGTDTIFTPKTRQQSPSEILTGLLHSYGDGTPVHAALIKSSVAITEDMLKESLNILKDYQPVLRMTTYKDTETSILKTSPKNGARFQEMENVNLRFEVQNVSGGRDAWMQCVERELETPLDVEGDTKWKLIYLQFREDDDISLECSTTSSVTGHCSGVLIFKMNPALCDATSLLDLIYQQFLHILNKVSSGLQSELTNYQNSLSVTPPADFEFPKIKQKTLKKSKNKMTTGRLGRIVTPSRIPLFSVDMFSAEGTVMEPIRIPLLVSEELIALSTKKKVSIEHVWITAVVNALSTLSFSEGLPDLPETVTCGWWKSLKTQPTNQLTSPLGKWTGYNVVKMKTYSEPVPSEVFWSEVKSIPDKLKKGTKPWGILHDAPDQLAAIDKHGIDGYNPEQFQAHVMLSYIQGSHKVAGGTRSTDPIQVEEYISAQSMSDLSLAPLHVSITDIRASKMTCILMYNRKWISRHFALTYAENIRALLDFVVHTQTVGYRQVSLKNLPPMLRMQAMKNMNEI